MDGAENTVEAREQSMQLQLQGRSAAVTLEESARGLAEARQELEGRGARYGLGFGYVKHFGSPRGLDGIKLEYAVTDGARTANLHVTISGTRLATLGFSRVGEEPDGQLRGWTLVVNLRHEACLIDVRDGFRHTSRRSLTRHR